MSTNVVGELWRFMRIRKKWWLLPIVAIMLMFGLLMGLGQTSVLGPLIYSIF